MVHPNPSSRFAGVRVVPVLDLQAGHAVRAVAGRRAEYRPLVPCSDPHSVARMLRKRVGHAEVYVADLDAIEGRPPARETIRNLIADGFRLRLDVGIRDVGDVTQWLAIGVDAVVVGLETVASPAALAEILANFADRAIFSLDLREGQPLAEWGTPRAIAETAIALGARRLLVLDLARVGGGEGTGTESLLREIHVSHPEVELWAGGGVRGPDDLTRLATAGVSVVLVASALHDGTL